MGKFTVIPQDTFSNLQINAGVLLKNFDPETGDFANEDIICATTGGINVSCVATYSDMGDGVDNAPVNTMELKKLDGWECKMSCSSVDTSADSIRLALGAADVVDGKVIPRRELKQTDFSTVWWVGDRADNGYVAVSLLNALSTNGFTLQTTDKGNGQVSIGLTGHVSIKEQDTVPMVFYSMDPIDSASTTNNEDGEVEA